MSKTFSMHERKIADTLKLGTTFKYRNSTYTVTNVAKPQVKSGECKTDIYLEAQSIDKDKVVFKISYKQENAEFIENKIKSDRALAILGENWQSIIITGTSKIKDEFENRHLIIKKGSRNGSITLGWKFELLDVKSGKLSAKLDLTEEQVKNVYSGENLPEDKKNAIVNDKVIENSGVANFMLRTDSLDDPQLIIDSLQTIDDYVKEHPDVYFACKALNYRSFKNKWDGDRPLAVQIEWKNQNNLLTPTFSYDTPLLRKGNEIANILINTLNELNIKNTDDINEINISNANIINE